MISLSQITQLKDFLDKSHSILVLINPNSNLDVLAASSTLFLSLEQAGKDVIYASPELPTNADQNLVGIDRVQTEIGNKNLVISFDYVETAVDKVSYHIGEETNRFYLTVQPQKGHLPLNKDSVEVSYAGSQADLVFVVGVSNYETLEHLYSGNEQFFSDTTVVSINSFTAEVGDIKFNTADSFNFSSALAEIIQQLDLEISSDGATNLLFSIEKTADSFRSLSTTPELLEIAAWLMRQGARRIKQEQGLDKAIPVNSKPNQAKTIVVGEKK